MHILDSNSDEIDLVSRAQNCNDTSLLPEYLFHLYLIHPFPYLINPSFGQAHKFHSIPKCTEPSINQFPQIYSSLHIPRQVYPRVRAPMKESEGRNRNIEP